MIINTNYRVESENSLTHISESSTLCNPTISLHEAVHALITLLFCFLTCSASLAYFLSLSFKVSFC